ncbi:MAG: serine/threonine-protein kinase [Verrucomicrobia bacterium]|nr:serine/threonine-protein kinase [Verrucomicrobiota bacterium]
MLSLIQELLDNEIQEEGIKNSIRRALSQGASIEAILTTLYKTHIPSIIKSFAAMQKEKPSLASFLATKRLLFETKKWFDISIETYRAYPAEMSEGPSWDAEIQRADGALLEILNGINASMPAIREAAKADFPPDYGPSLQKIFKKLSQITEHHIRSAQGDPDQQESWANFFASSKQNLEVFAAIAIKQREQWLEALLQNCRSLYFTEFKNLPFSLLYSWKGSLYVVMNVLGQVLGAGESKIVTRAAELQRGKIFALVKHKTLFKDIDEEEAKNLQSRNFMQAWRESDFLIRLQGAPGIIALHERVPLPIQGVNTLFEVEDYYEDGSLDAYFQEVIYQGKKEKAFDTTTAHSFALQLLTGLTRIHEAGIVHRDIKPENILLDLADPTDQKAVICDFNVACTHEEKHLHAREAFSPLYVAPEYISLYIRMEELGKQALASSFSDKLDIWSMGTVFYLLFFLEKLPWQIEISGEEELIKIYELICSLKEPWIPRKFESHPFYPLIFNMTRIDPTKRIGAKQALIDCQRIVQS